MASFMKAVRTTALSLVLVAGMAGGAYAQQGGAGSGSGGTAGGIADGPSTNSRSDRGTDWGWLGLLGLAGLAGLMGRNNKDNHRTANSGAMSGGTGAHR